MSQLSRNPKFGRSLTIKFNSIIELAESQTKYISDHPRAHTATAIRKVNAKIKKLATDKWLHTKEEHRLITVEKDENALSEESLLDGCYVIKSDVPRKDADMDITAQEAIDSITLPKVLPKITAHVATKKKL